MRWLPDESPGPSAVALPACGEPLGGAFATLARAPEPSRTTVLPMRDVPLSIASDEPAARVLCAALGAVLLAAPREEGSLEAWRERTGSGEARAQVVVAAWSADLAGCAITETSFEQ